MYKKLKKQNGEKFAQTIRHFHNGIFEIPDIDVILRHAGRDAKPLLPYLMHLLAANDNQAPAAPGCPFELLAQAGYDAFHADTLEKQNSIKKHFKSNELLCTFNDSARYKNYHMIHAVKKDVDSILRDAFNGKETRQDAYGTSVISIQILKRGEFISIKNRYNHSVSGCDNTFGSNPDNIIQGLSAALKNHFKVDFSAQKSPLPEDFVLINNQIFKYHQRLNDIYYGDGAWVKDDCIHTIDKSMGEALFDSFIFDNKSKTLKNIDPDSEDSFADDFNKTYGGNRALNVQKGNLCLNGDILIGAEKSRIKTVSLPELTTMGNSCLQNTPALTHFEAPKLTTMGEYCLENADALTCFKAPNLTTMGECCLENADALTCFKAPKLTTMGDCCLQNTPALTHFEAPKLTTMGECCLENADALTCFKAPKLTTMGDCCLQNTPALTHFEAPKLTTMGEYCLENADALTCFKAPNLTTMGEYCLRNADALTCFKAPKLTTMGDCCLQNTPALTHFEAPKLTTMGECCLENAHALTCFEAPKLTTMGDFCLRNADALQSFEAPKLTTMGVCCLRNAHALKTFKAPKLSTFPDYLKRFVLPRKAKPQRKKISSPQ